MTQGLQRKVKKREFNAILQSRIYKGRHFFVEEIKDLKIRYSEKSTYLLKIKDAIAMGYATIAFAFWERYSATSGNVIDPHLLRIEKDIVKQPTAQTFLRAAFGTELKDVLNKFRDLGELYFFLNKAEFDKEEIVEAILPHFTEGSPLKFSDFLGVALVSTTCQYVKEINEALQEFHFTAITTNLGNYIASILDKKSDKGEYVFPETFLGEAESIFNYFKEGINKWGFIDRKLPREEKYEKIQKIFGKHPSREIITLDYSDTSNENQKDILANCMLLQDYLIKSMGYINWVSTWLSIRV